MATNINLISQDPESKNQLTGKSSLIISVALVVLAVLTYVGLKAATSYYNSKAQALEEEVGSQQDKIAKSDFQDLLDFQERLVLADKIIAGRTSFESYLRGFSKYVVPEVRITSFDWKKDTKGLEISGRAASFDALSKELILLRSCKLIQSFEFKDAKEVVGTDTQTGGVDFSISATTKNEELTN